MYTQTGKSCTKVGQNYIVKRMSRDLDTIKFEQKE